MNDFSDLEAELKQLRPAAPSPELTMRVERLLAEPLSATPTAGILPQRKVSWSWFAFGGLGFAAAVAFFLLARVEVADQTKPQPRALAAISPAAVMSQAQAASGFVPEGLTRVVYNTRDEGLVYPEDAATPVRRVRSRSRETLQWRNPGTGASLRVSYPTEEVELIPISGQ